LKYDMLLADRMSSATGHRGILRSGAALLSVDASQKLGLNKALLGTLGEKDLEDVIPLNLAERMLVQTIKRGSASGAFMQARGQHEQPNTFKSYSARSSTIFGILTQMRDEFEANLSQEQKEEMKARADFEALRTSKVAQIATAKEKLDAMEGARADNQKALSDAKEDFEATRAQRTADVEFLTNLKVTCQGLNKEWAERSATRSEEIKAITEALAIIQDDDAADLLRKTVTLLQFASHADAGTRRVRAATVLRHLGRQPRLGTDDLLDAWEDRKGENGLNRHKLNTLAVSVELDSFTEVKAAMDKMIADLKDQQAEEVKSKAYCETQLDENEKTIYRKTEEKSDLEAKLDMLETALSKMNEEIAIAKQQIADTNIEIKKAGENREKENADFQVVITDQRATQAVLKKALTRLQMFYKSGAKASSLQVVGDSVQTPPVKFNTYKKHGGSVTVIGLIEQIIEDSKKVEAEALAGESKAQSEYEDFVKASNEVLRKLQETITMKTKTIAATKVDIEETKSAHVSTVGELESLESYKADLHTQCDFLLKNFDKRQSARLEEIEAIQQAKAILSGEK